MPSCMVQQISDCLRNSRALTDYEVQVIRAAVTDMQQATCLLQTLLRKGRTPCLLFFRCLYVCSPSLFHTVTRGLGRCEHKQKCVRDILYVNICRVSLICPSVLQWKLLMRITITWRRLPLQVCTGGFYFTARVTLWKALNVSINITKKALQQMCVQSAS